MACVVIGACVAPCVMAAPGACSWTLEEAEPQTAFRRWLSPGAEDSDCASEPVPGLRAVLAQAGLASYAPALESWCEEVGAAFLCEVQDEVDTIGEELQLSASQCRHLRRALAEASNGSALALFL